MVRSEHHSNGQRRLTSDTKHRVRWGSTHNRRKTDHIQHSSTFQAALRAGQADKPCPYSCRLGRNLAGYTYCYETDEVNDTVVVIRTWLPGAEKTQDRWEDQEGGSIRGLKNPALRSGGCGGYLRFFSPVSSFISFLLLGESLSFRCWRLSH